MFVRSLVVVIVVVVVVVGALVRLVVVVVVAATAAATTTTSTCLAFLSPIRVSSVVYLYTGATNPLVTPGLVFKGVKSASC